MISVSKVLVESLAFNAGAPLSLVFAAACTKAVLELFDFKQRVQQRMRPVGSSYGDPGTAESTVTRIAVSVSVMIATGGRATLGSAASVRLRRTRLHGATSATSGASARGKHYQQEPGESNVKDLAQGCFHMSPLFKTLRLRVNLFEMPIWASAAETWDGSQKFKYWNVNRRRDCTSIRSPMLTVRGPHNQQICVANCQHGAGPRSAPTWQGSWSSFCAYSQASLIPSTNRNRLCLPPL
ncbi:MAG: hypothetical protein ACLPWG_24355 [Steroidobacteraceae bacterium]